MVYSGFEEDPGVEKIASTVLPVAEPVLLVVLDGSSLGGTGKDGHLWWRTCRAKQSAQMAHMQFEAKRAVIDGVYTVGRRF